MNFNSRSRASRRLRVASTINVTPFVDVMLVLLVVFMVLTPMMFNGIEVDLPSIAAKSQDQKSDPIIISIDKSNNLYLMNNKISRSNLLPELKKISKDKESRIFIKGDKNLPYKNITDLMSTIASEGFSKLALVGFEKK